MSNLDKLLYLAGVSADFLDYAGRHLDIPHDLRCRALRVMGYPVDDPAPPRAGCYCSWRTSR